MFGIKELKSRLIVHFQQSHEKLCFLIGDKYVWFSHDNKKECLCNTREDFLDEVLQPINIVFSISGMNCRC